MAGMARHDHPIFTLLYRALVKVEDAGPVGRVRTEVGGALFGKLLIVGLGPGEDLHLLPAAVTEVVAIEPSASMRHAARAAVAEAEENGIPVELIDAVGEDLPLPDDSVDSVLFAYVLCSVDDPDAVIAEVRRVLKPGGVVAMLEHVAGRPGSWIRRWQTLVSPVWPFLAGGCHCDRDTRAVLERGGFDTAGVEDFAVAALGPVGAGIKGVALLAEPPAAGREASPEDRDRGR